MRLLIVTSIVFSFGILQAQDDDSNMRPRITGQRELEFYEDGSLTIQMTDLEVRDRDDWFYPIGFTMKLYPGENYTLYEYTVISALDFYGELRVPVTVNDGEEDSEIFYLKITVHPVNDPPII